MTNRVHRILCLVMSLVMVLSMVSFNAVADEYKVGSTITTETDDSSQLPALTNPALAWSGPVTLYNDRACGLEEHTHSLDTCSYREAADDEAWDFGMNFYYIAVDNPDGSDTYVWKECTKEEYDAAHHAMMKYKRFVWTCGKVAHTHTDECTAITGYQWTVTKANLNEHFIYNHIKVAFTNVQEGLSVTDVSIKVTYANGTSKVITKDDTDDYGALIFKDYHLSNKYAFISNDTDDKSENRMVGLDITYTYNGTTSTYSVNTHDGLEAARLACRDYLTNKNGLDFTIQVASTSAYYYKIVKNYYLDTTLVESETGDTVESLSSTTTLAPEATLTYGGNSYGLDTTSAYKNVDISASEDDSTKAVEITLNYRRYTVSHEFVSGTTGKTLPTGATRQLPENTGINMGGTAYPAESNFEDIVVKENGVTVGTWTFKGWDKESVESVNEPVKFTGTWTYTAAELPKNNFSVTYKFVAVPDDETLPEGVMNQLPTAGTAEKGAYVIPATSTFNDVEVKENGVTVGTWSFSNWDKAEVLSASEDVVFTGTWTYTAAEKTDPEETYYDVTYSFVSGTDGKTLPTDVTNQKPEKASVKEGTTVTPASDFKDVEVKENGVTVGTWTFKGWNPASATVNANTEFVGTWVYTEAQKHTVTYAWADAANVPADAKLPASGSYYAGETVKIADDLTSTSTKKGEKQGTWKFTGWTVSPEITDGKMPKGSVTVTGGWEFIEDSTFSLTVSNTSTGYEFKDGDTISFSVEVNGTKLNETYTATYSAKTGWTSFTVSDLVEGDEVTVTELSPHKNNYVLSVSDANGNHVAAKKGDYAQTVTVTCDTAIAFANAYTPYAEEYTPAPVVPVNPTIPTTGDSTALTLAVAMILMSAVVAFVAMRKREN